MVASSSVGGGWLADCGRRDKSQVSAQLHSRGWAGAFVRHVVVGRRRFGWGEPAGVSPARRAGLEFMF